MLKYINMILKKIIMNSLTEKIFSRFPLIDIDDQYLLRQITYNDAEDYLAYISNEDVNRYVPNECLPRNIEQAKNEIKYNLDLYAYKRSVYWAIARKSDNKLVGSCGFNYWNRDHSRAEISYDLARELWGKGIMTKTVKSVLGFAFIQMQLVRVEATVHPNNQGSLSVLRKCGFKKEGLLRKHKLLHGTFYDAIMLSLLQEEHLGF